MTAQPRETRSWAREVPGPIWAVVIALFLSFISTAGAVWKTTLDLSATIKPIQEDLQDIKLLMKENAAAFQSHQISMHPIMMTTHQKDMEQLRQAFQFQQDFLRGEFGKMDQRLGRIEIEVKDKRE